MQNRAIKTPIESRSDREKSQEEAEIHLIPPFIEEVDIFNLIYYERAL